MADLEVIPKAFLLENVRGLAYGVHRQALEHILDTAHSLGYSTRWQIVNAADYGAPQIRERCIVIGSLNGPITPPKPTHQKHEASTGDRRLKWVTAGDVLFDLDNLDGLWSYAMTEWLKLKLPQEDDKNRTRWPIHPLWGHLASVDWAGDGGPLIRDHSSTRFPEDKKLYSMMLSSLLGFMAKRGIDDLYQGQAEAMAELVSCYATQAKRQETTFDQFIASRLALKVRQYNMGMNNPGVLETLDRADLEAKARAYRKAKGD